MNENEMNIDDMPISHGSHSPKNGKITGTCAGERAFLRWAKREGWDHQQIINGWTASMPCAAPNICSFVIRTNDRMQTDAMRRAAFPDDILDMMANTRGSRSLDERRSFAFADWAVRVCAVAALRSVGMMADADRLATLPPIVDKQTAYAAADAADAADAAANAAAYAAYAAADAAAYAANAAAYAADAADAAYAAADAAANAAYAAANAANAAANAAYAAAYAADAAANAAAFDWPAEVRAIMTKICEMKEAP